MEFKKISASSLIVKRSEHPRISAITQNFHLIKRPLYSDSKADISFKSKARRTASFIGAGLRTFYPSNTKVEQQYSNIEFPHIRRKMQKRCSCKEKSITESHLIPYDQRIMTHTDMSSLLTLNQQNQRLKEKIKDTSMSINNSYMINSQKKNYYSNSSADLTWDKDREKLDESKASILEKDSRSKNVCWNIQGVEDIKNENSKVLRSILASKEAPIRDPRWQTLIRKSPSVIDLREMKIIKLKKSNSKILDVSYPYCEACKTTDWNFFQI